MRKSKMDNELYIAGTLAKTPMFSHYSFGEAFYESEISTKRLSGVEDRLPIIIPELYIGNLDKGTYVTVRGDFRSSKIGFIGKKYIFPQTIDVAESLFEDFNEIYLKGELVKKTFLKKVSGDRVVNSGTLKVAKKNGGYSYIPFCVFGRLAYYLDEAEIGELIEVVGRVQKRKYINKDGEKGSTIEVSCSQMARLEEGVNE